MVAKCPNAQKYCLKINKKWWLFEKNTVDVGKSSIKWGRYFWQLTAFQPASLQKGLTEGLIE
jgi:hypothetical protein